MKLGRSKRGLSFEAGSFASISRAVVARLQSRASTVSSGFLCLSGSMAVIRDDARRVLKPGDLAVNDLSYPNRISSEAPREAITFKLSEGAWPIMDKNRASFRNLVVERDEVSAPLRSCLYFLADRLMHNDEEVNAVFEAVLNLLPIDAAAFGPRTLH